MSFDIYLDEPDGKSVCAYAGGQDTHGHDGSIMQLGGTPDMRLNVTYNHTPKISEAIGHHVDGQLVHYREWLGGKTGQESLPRLHEACQSLAKPDADDDEAVNGFRDSHPGAEGYSYWCPSNANARRVLQALIDFAEYRPDGVWRWEH